MRFYVVLLLLLIALGSIAQSASTENDQLLDDLYASAEFEEVKRQLLAKESTCELSVEDERLLARCYEQLGEIDQAIYRNLQIVKTEDYSNEDLIRLADILKQEARYDESLEILEIYRLRGGENARQLMASCQFAKGVLNSSSNCDLENIDVNTSSTEYGVTFHDGQVVYASKRQELSKDFGIKGERDLRPNSVFYKVDHEGSKPLFVNSDRDMAYGFASYASNGQIMVFVRSQMEEGGTILDSENKSMGLFYAKIKEDGSWSSDLAFPYNSEQYANGFPYLSENGETMIYASNMPHGYGGFDLYISHFVNGQWTPPVNLGEDVNTQGNEITPYLADGTLYFASDYLPGLGGYDVYSIRKVEDQWVDLAHMGACINSAGNDFGLVLDPQSESAYFSSSREGGKGHEDIYRINDFKTVEEIHLVSNEVSELPRIRLTPSSKEDEVGDLAMMVPKTAALERQYDVSVIGDNDFQEMTEMENLFLWDESMVIIKDDPFIESLQLVKGEKVYFIQIAALSTYKNDLSRFNHFNRYGNVYGVKAGNMVKVRIGYYSSKEEAIQVLKTLKRKGIREAFIVGDILDVSRLDLIAASKVGAESMHTDYRDGLVPSYKSVYKVRVAAYRQPSVFRTSEVSDLGHIEHWTKSEWKIIILSGYTTLGQAKEVLGKLQSRGFQDAYIVKDNNGTLEKVD